jgi:hypothetical protein
MPGTFPAIGGCLFPILDSSTSSLHMSQLVARPPAIAAAAPGGAGDGTRRWIIRSCRRSRRIWPIFVEPASVRVRRAMEASATGVVRHGDLGLRQKLVGALPWMRAVFLVWLATRIGYVLLTYLATVLHLYPAVPQFSGFILSWQRWDANWYVLISRTGYTTGQSTNFFPLYPMSIRAVAWLLGDGAGPIFPQPDKLRLIVGMALSNLGLLVGLYAIARLALHERGTGDGDAGVRAARITLAYPFAIAWTIAYAEGFFLAFAGLTLLFARRGRWYPAAVAAALAGLTRPLAVILVLPLAWEYGRQHGWWQRRPQVTPGGVLQGLVVVGSAPIAMAAYFGYGAWRFGQFLLPGRTQFTYWHHVAWPPWQTFGTALHRMVHLPATSNLLTTEVFLIGLFALITLVTIRRVPFAFTLYTVALLYLAIASPVPSQTDLIWGSSRYLAQAIPIYLIVAGWAARRPWLDTLVASVGFLVQGAVAVALFQGKPVL